MVQLLLLVVVMVQKQALQIRGRRDCGG